jgi:replication-associated recombination protein RarA
MVAKANRLHSDPTVPMKLLLYGPPGVGKTSIADMVAAELSGCPMSIEEFNGKLVTVEVVKQWLSCLSTGSLFGVYSVKIINELDRCTHAAQDLLLGYLDRLPPRQALIGTSNLQLDLLTERFQTRFQAIKLGAPTTEDIADLLQSHWPVDEATALRIAVGSGGCVRAALADLESWLDLR